MENSISIDKWILFLDGAMMAAFLLVPLFGRKLGTWSDRQAVWWAAVGMAVTAGVLVYFGFSQHDLGAGIFSAIMSGLTALITFRLIFRYSHL